MNIRSAANRVISAYLTADDLSSVAYGEDHAVIVLKNDDAIIVTIEHNSILPTILARYLGSDDYLPTLYPTIEDAENALPATTLVFHASAHHDDMSDVLDHLMSIDGFIPLTPMGDCGTAWAEPATTPDRHIMAAILPEPGESWSLDVEYHNARSFDRIRSNSAAITTLGDWSAVVHIS